MNKPLNRNAVLRAGLILILLVVLQGCQENPPIESWDSPQMLAIKKEWDDLDNSFSTQSKDEYFQHLKKLDDILRKNLTEQDMLHLVATSISLPSRGRDRSKFTNAVLKYMTETFILNNDKKKLLAILMARFPDEVFWEERIEYAMAKRMDDSILFFGEAYSKCRDEKTRRHLAVAVRRAFLGLGIEGKDDAEFVENAMQWYKKETDNLTLTSNIHYSDGYPLDYDEFPEVYDDERDTEMWKVFHGSVWPFLEHYTLFDRKSETPSSERSK